MSRRHRAVETAPVGDAVISIQGVSKRFGSHQVLEDITFDVPRGETSAILGPSGTGKSVLLKVIIGLLRPETGQVYIDGEPMVGVREKEVLRIRRKIGVLFQDGALFGSMNLFDNIAFPLIEHTTKTDKEIQNIVLHKSELVGLVNHLHKLPGEVSGGMRKRAGLARALVLEPEILFFDEPDSGLDPVRVAYLDGLINSSARRDGGDLLHHQPQHRVGEENRSPPRSALSLQVGRLRIEGGDDVLEGARDRAVPGRSARRSDQHGRDVRCRGGSGRSRRFAARSDRDFPGGATAGPHRRAVPSIPTDVPNIPTRRSPTASRSIRGGHCETGRPFERWDRRHGRR